MMHAPVVDRAVPKNAPVTTTRQPLTPAGYFALRRKASKLDIAQVAALIAVKAKDQAEVRALLRQLERPGVVARDRKSVALFRKAFRIDPNVYHQLATQPADQHPAICLGCGCSDWDACEIWPDDRCGWAAPNLCTCCGGNDLCAPVNAPPVTARPARRRRRRRSTRWSPGSSCSASF